MPDVFEFFDPAVAASSVFYTSDFAIFEDPLLSLYHALWKEFHSKQNPTPDWFEDWCKRVPGGLCGCGSWLRDYIANNPPDYENWYAYSVKLHNAVNVKLGKAIWVLDKT